MSLFYITNGKLSTLILPFVLPQYLISLVKSRLSATKNFPKNLFSIDIFGKLRYTFGKFSDSHKNEFKNNILRKKQRNTEFAGIL